ncbi:hypothetical protein EXU85_03635 [Spirosoma sp. KCTC 42546]|uniref:hypothetical protein n=1 Tax=Spirosoma sp. KCTC 42546 TaxID=2520506 RepID=UPI0011584331|nr:hypothetical protein [Spirosoma sp. KCTC 42546]QDK77734.1 hypothetical protein EXU85_03635 [Spirosoma sp. KCTC 42546]
MPNLLPSESILGNILHGVGLIFCLLLLLFGLLYTFNGEIIISAFLTILAGAILIAITRVLVRLKSRKDAYKPLAPEYALMGIYLLVFLILFPLSYHVLAIDLIRKTEIKKVCLDKLKLLDVLKDEYSKQITDKQNSLGTNAHILFNKYKQSGGKDTKSMIELNNLLGSTPGSEPFDVKTGDGLDKAIEVAQDGIKQKYNLKEKGGKDPEKDLNDFKAKAQDVFTDWQIREVGYYYQNIDRVFENYKTAAQAPAKMPDFVPTIAPTNEIDLQNSTKMLRNGSETSWVFSLLGLLLIHWCILAPYFLTTRPDMTLKRSDSADNSIYM